MQLESGETVELDHGHVVIAAITSCTNTSNPSVMLGAGLLAKKAVERGLRRQPWVKTSLAPGSTVVTEYLEKSGLDKYLDELQFNLVGYGCTTCIGNSGPLPEEISKAVDENGPGRLLGALRQPQLRGPDQPGYPGELPRLAAAGRRLRARRAHGRRPDERAARAGTRTASPSTFRDIWPTSEEIKQVVGEAVRADMFTKSYADVFTGDERWNADRGARGRPLHLARLHLRAPAVASSTAWMPEPKPVEPIRGARVLALLGDSVTTDHISPAGAIKKRQPGRAAG